MKWSIKVGRILGIDVYVHLTFLLLLLFIGLSQGFVNQSVEAALAGIIFFAGLFSFVLLHEYGHALMAQRYGIKTRDITLLPIGGLARLERMPDKPSQELLVALAGPAVNVAIAAALFGWLALSGAWQPGSAIGFTPAQGSLWERWLAANIFLVLFNLLPAFPMDGGRVLRALLAMRLPYARATRIAAYIGQGMAALFGILGLLGNPLLLFIALFVWIGASQEATAAEMKSSLSGVPVRDAMLTDFKSLAPDQNVGEAVELILAGSQRDFPVVEQERVVGLLLHSDVFETLREYGANVPVDCVMRPDFTTVSADSLLENVMSDLKPEKGLTLPVLAGDQLVGLLTAENIGEYVMFRSAMVGKGTPPRPTWRKPPTVAPPVLAPHSTNA